MVSNYKKRPIIIQALQYTVNNIVECINFCPNLVKINDNVYIKTLEGDMEVSVGDFIIKGVVGEFYPCKPDIFKKTYEPA